MPLPPTYTPPKDKAELERRKVLDAQLKEFATDPNKAPDTWEGLSGEASKVGVSPEQLINRFQQYSTAPSPTEVMGATGVTGAPSRGSLMANIPQANTTSMASSQPSTRLLDRYDQMQKAPMGSTSTLGQTRNLESDTGTAFRMARKLQRMGFGGAAEKLALSGGMTAMNEPAIKTQEFIGLEEQSKKAGTAEAQAAEELKRKQFAFQNKLLDAQNKALASGQFDFSKYGTLVQQ